MVLSNWQNYILFWYKFFWENDNYGERNQEKKQRSDTKNEAKKIDYDNFSRINKEKFIIDGQGKYIRSGMITVF